MQLRRSVIFQRSQLSKVSHTSTIAERFPRFSRLARRLRANHFLPRRSWLPLQIKDWHCPSRNFTHFADNLAEVSGRCRIRVGQHQKCQRVNLKRFEIPSDGVTGRPGDRFWHFIQVMFRNSWFFATFVESTTGSPKNIRRFCPTSIKSPGWYMRRASFRSR